MRKRYSIRLKWRIVHEGSLSLGANDQAIAEEDENRLKCSGLSLWWSVEAS